MSEMNRMLRNASWVSCGMVLASLASPASAIDILRAKVYGYETLKQGETELSYMFGYVAKSDLTMNYFDKTGVAREKLVSHTAELEYGLTDRWSISVYGDFEQPKNEDLKFIQARSVVTRYRLFDKGERFFDPGIYFEYYVPQEHYRGAQREKLEARIILEKNVRDWSIRVNPILEKGLSDGNLGEGLVLEYAASVFKEMSPQLAVGVEAYGEFGPLANTNSYNDQQHFLAPAVEYKIKDGMAVSAALAKGLTDATDDLIVKATFELEL